MRPDVPPDLLGVVDAVGADQQTDVAFEFRVTRESVRNPRAGEVLKYLGAVAFVAGIDPEPEGRVGGEGHDVGQEVAHRIHNADGGFAVFNAHVHVQAEYEVGTGHQL